MTEPESIFERAEKKMAEEKKSRLEQSQGIGEAGIPDDEPEPQQTAQAVWSDTVNLGADKLSIPYITLAQGLSKAVTEDKAKMGQWLMQGYEPYDEIIIVPLKFGVSRNYSIENANKDRITACYSPTGAEHGIALLEEGPGMPCEDCPLSDWQPTDRVDDKGRKQNDPPPCKESYDFLVWSETHGTLARIGFRSNALKAGRLLATLGKTKGLASFAVELASHKEQKKNFTFAVPDVTIIGGEQGESYVEMGQSILALGAG